MVDEPDLPARLRNPDCSHDRGMISATDKRNSFFCRITFSAEFVVLSPTARAEDARRGGTTMRRVHFDSAIWHVMARGSRRLELFQDGADYEEFLHILTFALTQSGATVWAFALMNNHYHLLVETGSRSLGRCMHRLNKMYSSYHNKRYGLVGRIFEGPYLAFPQKTPLLSLSTIAYIFANPVKAGACGAPEDYVWSSYRSFIGCEGSPLAIDATPFLRRLDPDQKRVWRLFHLGLKRELQRPPKPAGSRPTMAQVHLSQFAWLLDYAQDSPRLLAGENSEQVAIYWGRQSGIAPRVMARALGRTSREIRELLYVFKKRLRSETALTRLMAPP
ncbi:MAG TPA: transposase, partial [Planctomycetota bacterium]|nr:transposase [Planctomycetota bacterium]